MDDKKQYYYIGIVKDVNGNSYNVNEDTHAKSDEEALKNLQFKIKPKLGLDPRKAKIFLNPIYLYTEDELKNGTDYNASEPIRNPKCPNCGTELNDAGECPLCDLGDETVLDESVQTDSQGNNLTPEQIKFFKDSKARDDSGHLLVLYHGSKSKTDFDTFIYDPKHQTGQDFGKAFYFTNNKSKAQGYSVDTMTDERVKKYTKDKDELLKKFTDNPNDETKKAFMDYTGTNKLSDLLNDEDYENNTERLGTLKTCYLNIKQPFILDANGDYFYNVYPKAFEDAHKNNCDGIIVKNVIDNPRGKSIPMDVYVVFNENQIKSINNTNPTNSSNINEDLTQETDSAGNPLSPEQVNYFKDSKIRDSSGKLLLCHHGTMNGKFDVFEIGRYVGRDEFAWFSPDREYTKNYSNDGYKGINSYTFNVYLNVKNPFDTGDTHQPAVEDDGKTPTKYLIDLANRLNVDVEDLIEIGQEETNFGTEFFFGIELFDITRTSGFRDILKERGYDGQIAMEMGSMTIGVMYQDQIKNIDNTKPTNSSNINESKVFTFPNSKQAIDYYWKDRNVNVERIPIKKLVDDNNLLDDDDLNSYHQRQWDNKSASEFSIDKDKASKWRMSEVPYAVRKKDGRLELGDGRHRTRALYNDGYEYVELPVIIEESVDNEFNIKNVYHCTPSKEIDVNKSETMLWFTEDIGYGFIYGDNIFIADISLHNPIDVGNTDLYIRDIIPTKFRKEFIDIANKLNVEPKELANLDKNAQRILSIVQLKSFKELCIKNGYDGIKSIEDGSNCYCVFNLSQVDLKDIDLNSSLEEAFNVDTKSALSPKMKKIVEECIGIVKEAGYDLMDYMNNEYTHYLYNYPLRFWTESSRINNLGSAYYPEYGYTMVTFSKHLEELPEDEIKDTVLHELGHVIAYQNDFENYIYYDGESQKCKYRDRKYKGKLSGHGKVWKNIMNKISAVSGIPFSRLSDSENWKEVTKDEFPYKFVCPGCGSTLRYARQTPFVKTYGDDLPNGNPRWYCTKCYKDTGEKIKFVKTEDSK